MSLQFVLGSSGSGKTEYIYREIVRQAGEHPKQNFLVIVPEQFTMQTQQKLVELAPNHAIMNIDVLSFKRLAYRVFDEMGRNDVQVLEETGKNLVLRKLARLEEEKLTVLRPNMNRMGYIGEVKSLISELVQYNVSPDRLEEVIRSKELSPVLRAKLSDIVVMYRAFEEFMAGNYITAEEILNILSDIAADSEILRNSVLVFDEFTGFTPIQNNLMRELLKVAERVIVTLTIDANEDFYFCRGEEELFYLSKKTIHSLMQMAELLHVEVLDPIVMEGSDRRRFQKAPDLAFLEHNLFRTGAPKDKEDVQQIHLAAARTPREELTLVAREINRLIREGYRYREIAVVTGSMETYQNYMEPLFGKYEIPYFMDTTKEVLFHPFTEFIRAGLEMISSDFSYESVMRFLRCGFSGIEEDAIDRLDNYLLAIGIRGSKAWSKRWMKLPGQEKLYDLEKLNEIRAKIWESMLPLTKVFAEQNATVSHGIVAFYEVLTSLDIEKQLWQREQQYLEQNQQTKAKEYGQIYKIVLQLFEKYNELLGEEPLAIEEFAEVLDAGLSAASVAVIPPGYDSVTFGDIERTRLNHIRILFFVGVNDGIIPKSANAGGIISEYEREALLDADMELAPGAREQAFIQRFYLYRNLTKPSEQLYISYSKVDSEGKAIRPSYLIGAIRKLFPKLILMNVEEIEAREDFYTKQAALDYLIHGERDDAWYALAKYFRTGEESEKEMVERLLRAFYATYENSPISRGVALALYGRKPEGSVTRLERFAACAYAHYLQYGLKLSERQNNSFESVDMGNIYHDALQRYSMKLKDSEYDWFDIPDSQRETLSEEAMQEAVAAYPDMSIYASAESKHRAKRMMNIFKQTVWALTKQVRAGQFVPKEFEVRFSELDHMDALEYALTDDVTMKLTGRIDRVDTYDGGDRLCVKVIDYKSGNTSFDLIRIYQGLQLQLVVYMNAAMELTKKNHASKDILPGGILYYHIDDPVINEDTDMSENEEEHALLQALRPDGLVNADEQVYLAMDENLEGRSEVIPIELKKSGELSSRSKVATTEEFAVLEQYVHNKIAEQGRKIYEGDVSVNPYQDGMESSCDFCPYASVCGIDTKIPGYQYRHLESMRKEEVLDRMQTENAKKQ